MIKELLMILIASSLVNNVVLSQFLGLCPFLGVSKKTETATGMGVAPDALRCAHIRKAALPCGLSYQCFHILHKDSPKSYVYTPSFIVSSANCSILCSVCSGTFAIST